MVSRHWSCLPTLWDEGTSSREVPVNISVEVDGVRIKNGPETEWVEVMESSGAEFSFLINFPLTFSPFSHLHSKEQDCSKERSQLAALIGQVWINISPFSFSPAFSLFFSPSLPSLPLLSLPSLSPPLISPILHILLLQASVSAAGGEVGNLDSDKHHAQRAVSAKGMLAK